MTEPALEHTNITVADTLATAGMLERIFGWTIRWQGDSLDGGYTVHVGTSDSYLALYSTGTPSKPAAPRYTHLNGLNHIGVMVSDLDKIEQRVIAEGIRSYSHYDYEPGRRFYFKDGDGLEFEVVSYA